MQISNGTVSVIKGNAVVTASSDVDWSDLQIALQYGNPVLFSLLGLTEVPRRVIASESPVTSGSGNWELTLVSNWTEESQSAVKYMVHLSFTPNLGMPLPAGGERQWAQLLEDALTKLDAAYGGAGIAVPPGVVTTLVAGRTLYVSGELDIPADAELDTLDGAAVEVG